MMIWMTDGEVVAVTDPPPPVSTGEPAAIAEALGRLVVEDVTTPPAGGEEADALALLYPVPSGSADEVADALQSAIKGWFPGVAVKAATPGLFGPETTWVRVRIPKASLPKAALPEGSL